MLTPESPGPDDVPSGGWIVNEDLDAFDHLVPKTTIDHLLSEEERKKAEQERKEFEAVGRTLFLKHLKEVCGDMDFWPESEVYPMAYELASNWLASDMLSPAELRESLLMIEGPLYSLMDRFWASIREAWEDALEDRPPKSFGATGDHS